MLLDILEQVDIIIEFEIGMNAALQQNARAAPGDEFLDLLADLLVGQQVAFWTGGLAIEGAEAAVDDTDIGVIDVAIYQEGHNTIGMAMLADGVGGCAQFVQVAFLEEPQSFFQG